MFTYFVPISLLVLAGFALGLVVGWLTWVSSRAAADQEPAKQADSEHTLEPAAFTPDPLTDWSIIPDHVPDWSTLDLPVWRMREISPPEHSDAAVSSARDGW